MDTYEYNKSYISIKEGCCSQIDYFLFDSIYHIAALCIEIFLLLVVLRFWGESLI